jgi:hypothetical protein
MKWLRVCDYLYDDVIAVIGDAFRARFRCVRIHLAGP